MFNEMLDVLLNDLNPEDINIYKKINLFILKDRSVTVTVPHCNNYYQIIFLSKMESLLESKSDPYWR